MGMTLMADDVQRILGHIEGVQSEIVKRLDRQDQRADEDRRQRAIDKDEAIKARETRHEENKSELRQLRASIDSTAEIARDNKRWIDEKGQPLITRVDELHGRVAAIEEGKKITAAEERGSSSVWTWIWGSLVAAAGAVGSVLTALLGLSPETIDRIKGFFHGG